MADAANHIFLPWVAPGMAANIPAEATESLSAAQAAAVSLKMRLQVNSEQIEKTARLYGPGDVTAIDPQQVVRVEPRHRTTDFEPNYLPGIEFDRPDFPWLFTPAKADVQGRLRPWLCLVVVRKQPGVEVRPASTLPVSVLEIKAPARPADELPELAESHLWAHAQVTGASKGNLKTALESQPAANVSRLLCPRRLDAETEYIACVVPAFEVGRRAGLNESLDGSNTLAPSWTSGDAAPAEIKLPVYYSWEFRTGRGGDFEELVRRLEPRELPSEVGKRPMDISDPGFTMQPKPSPDTPGSILGLEGALRVVGTAEDDWPDGVRVPFQRTLQTILNTPWQLATTVGVNQDPIVAPPIYGCWHAGVHAVPLNGQQPASWPTFFWLDELNLDPRNRAVAAVGTQVVQDQQEQLMASAWEQLGDIQKINQRLRQAQLSRAVNTKYLAKTFNRFPEETFFKVVAPANSRLAIQETQLGQPSLLVQRLGRSLLPSTAVSPSLRKIARPRGPMNREYKQANAPGINGIFTLFSVNPAARFSFFDRSRGAVAIDGISQILTLELANRPGFVWVNEPPIPGHWERMRAEYPIMLSTFRQGSLNSDSINLRQSPPNTPAGFREAVVAHHAYLSTLFAFPPLAGPPMPFVARDIKMAAMISLNPATAVSNAARSAIDVGSAPLQTGDELDPIMDAPTFPQPMYEVLRDLSQDLLFPGLEHVPPNTVQLLQTNAKFIESFMVGLNTEMGRELLWRGYPTDQRGTYFRQFWDTASAANPRLDITPIHKWAKRSLGGPAGSPASEKLVLLVRGELLRRYPGTVIYAVKAVLNNGKREPSLNPIDESHPIFRGSLDPDVNFIGFDLTAASVVAGEGWFFVFQQQPTEPRFGLDDDPFGAGESGVIPALNTWNDLNWAHVAPGAAELKALSHIPVRGLQLAPIQSDKGTWGRNSAHMAYIVKQRLVRIAIHATEMLP